MKTAIKIIIAITATIAAAVAIGAGNSHNAAAPKEHVDSIISLVVSNKERLTQIITCRTWKDTIMVDCKDTGHFWNRTRKDTCAIYIAHTEIAAGVNLSKLKKEDFRIENDTLYVSIPYPEILDIYINVNDIDRVYDEDNWEYDKKISSMTERAKTGIRRSAENSGILETAGAKARQSLGGFLCKICDMPVVINHSESGLAIPQRIG